MIAHSTAFVGTQLHDLRASTSKTRRKTENTTEDSRNDDDDDDEEETRNKKKKMILRVVGTAAGPTPDDVGPK